MLRIQVKAESICLMLALVTHTEKIKSFDGIRGGSHEMLIGDVCHNYQFWKVILINVTHIAYSIGSCIFVKTLSYVSKVFSMQTT